MSIPLTINGQVFEYPQNFDENWGIEATGWAQAVTSGALYLQGGSFPLTSPVDFGSSFGLLAKSLTSKTLHPSLTGYLALAKTDFIGWRNNANSADLLLGIDGSNNLTFNGIPLGTTSLMQNHIFVGNASNVPADVPMSGDATIVAAGTLTIANGAINNAKVASGAAIAVNKLAALTANRAVATDSSGFLTPSATTDTELGYVNGVTSSIQAQINAISATTVPSGAMLDFAGTVAPSGWLLCDGSSYATASQPSLFAAIGYTWGGSGPNFNVPNMTRRVGMGSGGVGTGTIGNAVGNTGGEEAHSQTSSELATHTHNATSVVTAMHQHSTAAGGVATFGTGGSFLRGNFTGTSVGAVDQTSGPTNTQDTVATTNANAGSGTAANVIQPAAIVLKIIKT